MHSVKVRKPELLEKLQANRETHRGIFLEAQDGYRKKVIEHLDRMLKDAREGRKIVLFINLRAPEDHTRDYDRAIAMLGASVDEEVEITAREFENFWLDRWDWTGQFVASNSGYVQTRASVAALSALGEPEDE